MWSQKDFHGKLELLNEVVTEDGRGGGNGGSGLAKRGKQMRWA